LRENNKKMKKNRKNHYDSPTKMTTVVLLYNLQPAPTVLALVSPNDVNRTLREINEKEIVEGWEHPQVHSAWIPPNTNLLTSKTWSPIVLDGEDCYGCGSCGYCQSGAFGPPLTEEQLMQCRKIYDYNRR
jgi:hypothetical protein